MKKLLIYAIVLIGVLFIGFTTYYFIQNKEYIGLKIDPAITLCYNVGETFTLDEVFEHTEPNKGTVVSVGVNNENILGYNSDTQTFLASAGGDVQVVITTNNKNFERFAFSVRVGDGSTANPYFIRTAKHLASIGTGNWKLNNSYEVVNSIDLNTPDTKVWAPIANSTNSFQGTFNGGDFEIYNLNVTTSGVYGGLFGVIGENGKVENVKLVDANINGSFVSAGLIAGVNYGKVGLVEVVSATITNTNDSGVLGGIVGTSSYKVTRSEVYMSSVDAISITSNGTVGGIVGSATGNIITDCKANIELLSTNGNGNVGGIVGYNNSYINTDSTTGKTTYRYSLVKNCLSLIHPETLSATVGAIVGVNADNANDFHLSNNYTGNLFSATGLNALGRGTDINCGTLKSTAELMSKDTYEGFNFSSVWTIEDGVSIAKVDFANTYSGTVLYDPGEKVTNKDELINTFNTIISNPGLDVTYEIELTTALVDDSAITMADLGVDVANGGTWTPIGTVETPFAGKILVKGEDLTFKGFKIVDKEYSGFFGVTNNAVIDGITFEDFTISNGQGTGLFAGTIVAYAENTQISNCNIYGLDINTAQVIGGAVGYIGSGAVDSLTINGSWADVYANKIIANSTVKNIVGGAVGQSYAVLNNIYVSLDVCATTIQVDKTATVGGVVGENNGEATLLKNESALISGSASDSIIGGVVGINRKTLTKSLLSDAGITMPDNQNSVVGGVVGVNEGEGTVYGSGFTNAEISGCYVGGIAGSNAGTLTESYSEGYVKGKFLGGLASTTTGQINNCYTTATLEGLYDDGNVCGLVYTIKAGKVEFCFSATTIGGKGTLSAETYTPFRMGSLAKWLSGKSKTETGEIETCVIINYGSAERQSISYTGFGRFFVDIFSDPYKGWISCTDEDCKGPNYSVFVNNTFLDSIWSLGDASEGTYPKLMNAHYNPVEEEPEEPIVPEEPAV